MVSIALGRDCITLGGELQGLCGAGQGLQGLYGVWELCGGAVVELYRYRYRALYIGLGWSVWGKVSLWS